MNIQPALISKFVQSLKMLKSNHVTFENLRKLLHPLVSAVYFKLEENTWTEYSKSNDMRKGNEIMQWQSLYRKQDPKERALILQSLAHQK